MTPFGEKIRELRRIKGVSQAEMAEALDVTPAYLSALEHGKRGAPSWPFLQKVYHYFGLIWDDAEELKQLADLSRPKVTIDSAGLSPKATLLINKLSGKIQHLPDEKVEQLLSILSEDKS